MITLSNIHEFTDQEVFDYVTEQLLIQNKRSGTDTKCFYRSSDGSKCAVGLLMMDDYRKEFDYCKQVQNIPGRMVWNSMPLVRILKDFYPNAVPRFRLLNVLQYIHDYFEPEEWQIIFPEVRKELFYNVYSPLIKNYNGLTAKIKEYHESI